MGLVWDLRAVPERMKKRNLMRDVGERAPLLMTKDKKAKNEARAARPVVVVGPAEPDLG